MDVFRKKNYRLSTTIPGMDRPSFNTTVVLDTAPAQTWSHKRCFPNAWSKTSIATDLTRIRASGNDPVKFAKFIPPQVRLRDFTVKIWFRVVKGLAVIFILCTQFIDKLIKSISTMDRVVELFRSSPVPNNEISAHDGAALRNASLSHCQRL